MNKKSLSISTQNKLILLGLVVSTILIVGLAVFAITNIQQKISEVYEEYEKQLLSNNAIDFDEVFAEVIADLYNEHPTYVTDYFAHTSSEDIFFDEMAKDGDEPQIQLLGHPSFTQEDPRFNSQYGEYDTLLLQIPSIEDEIMWGDMGIANFFIRKEDLERFDFSRVIYNWDCY